MKKILVIFLVLSTMSFAYGFAGGKAFSSGGSFIIKDTPEVEVATVENTGFYLEFYPTPTQQKIVEAGLGLKFNSYAEESTDTTVASVTTIYGVARFRWDSPSFIPYVQFRAGYPYAWDGNYIKNYKSGINNNLKGQAYASVGAGFELFFLDVSANYEWNTFNLASDSWVGEKDVAQNTFSINLGFKY